MRLFIRLMSYGKPFGGFWVKYFFTTIFSVIFGALNFTLLVPLLRVIFGAEPPMEMSMPDFQLNVNYFIDIFNYFFSKIFTAYGAYRALWFVAAIILTSVFLSNVSKYLANYVMTSMRSRVMRNLRKDLFEKINNLQLNFFKTHNKGDVLSTASNDVNEIQNSVVAGTQVVFQEPFMLIAYLCILIYMSPQLTLYTILVLPASALIIVKLAKKLRSDTSKSQLLLGKIIGFIDEVITGARIVRAFNAKKYINDKFDKDNEGQRRMYRKINNRVNAASPLSEFLGIVAVCAILLYGGILVLEGDMDASMFLTYIIIFSQLLVPAKAISTAITTIQRGLVSGKRVFDILDEPITIKDAPNAVDIAFNKEIELKNVSFAYQVDTIIHDISLTIPKGKMYALVGQSGSGKTTLVNLIPRFWDVTKGSISIDGVNIKDIKLESLYDLMGIVTQEAILFNDTIYNNIAFGMDVTEQQVTEAAKIANAHEFITNTEEGYQTNVGDAGGRLSGGQRQRVAIARAVLKNPPILILDEATSALDTESEKLVQDALTKLMQNRTSIVIAHRLSTIQNADCIVVVHDGRIVEQGSHEELVKIENGVYQKLSLLQTFKLE
ncbi:MAG: ABC transporter ATP-binding protein/permease [Prevotellaceae bacterium]|nr:ABC transporter ATP-binding protein/permease [Prevotellaceae bacterium]